MAKHLNLMIGLYNNYFNRIVKKEDYDFHYFTVMGTTYDIKNINFNPGDGILTKVILGKGDYLLPDSETRPIQPDYAILYSTELDNPPYADAKIISRWFIIESVRTRGGQYELTLKRDVMVDYYNKIILAPTFIEKARLRDDDPLLFNSEGMSFNQIKVEETALKDETQCGWVVGYVPSNSFEEAKDVVKPVVVQETPDITVTNLSSWSWYKNCTVNPSFKYLSSSTGNSKIYFHLKNNWTLRESERNYRTYWKTGWSIFKTDGSEFNRQVVGAGNFALPGNFPAAYNNFGGYVFTTANQQDINSNDLRRIVAPLLNNSTFNGYVSALLGADLEIGDTSTIVALKDKILKDNSTGLLYRISLTEIGTTNPIVVDSSTPAGSTLLNYTNSNITRVSGSLSSQEMKVELADTAYAIVLTAVTVQAGVQIDATRAHLEDAPYDMFCIPFSNDISLDDGNDTFTCSKAVALGIATEIGNDAGSGAIYDIQILPYCPCRELIAASANPSQVLDISGINCDIIKDCEINGNTVTYGTKKLSAVIWCTHSTFQVELSGGVDFPLNPSESAYTRALTIKESNECDLYRLCSGNYNGIFEFSPAKSNGFSGYLADCTYKPYQPYIHVIPKLKGLYGDKFVEIDDTRGLICGGDFSLPQLSNAWANYQLNNKTYNDVFKRELEHIDVTNKIAQQEQLAQSISGGFTGAASGAMTGAIAGAKAGPYGAAIGAGIGGLAGGVGSTVGGVMDYRNLIALQEENRSYTVDMYHYNLQNIQAIPSSLTRVSSLTFNTRIWPFVEHYTCTDREKEAFRNKLIYNGMTTMVIGKLEDYIDPTEKHFIKGQIIRFPTENYSSSNIEDDYHVAKEIYNELLKGVYL